MKLGYWLAALALAGCAGTPPSRDWVKNEPAQIGGYRIISARQEGNQLAIVNENDDKFFCRITSAAQSPTLTATDCRPLFGRWIPTTAHDGIPVNCMNGTCSIL